MGFHLADCFERVADAAPSAAALVDPNGTLSYAQLDRRANQLARALQHLGVERDDPVAIVLPNRSEHIETLLAAWKLGAVPINVNTRYTTDEVAYVLSNADARAVVTERRIARTVERAHEGLPTLVADDPKSYEAALTGQPAHRVDANRSGSDRYVLYTGGTTGMPKGAVWRHDDIFFGALGGRDIDGNQLVHSLDELAAIATRDGSSERVYVACPLMHGTAQWMAIRTLLRGGALLLDGSPGFDAAGTWKRTHDLQATALVITGDAFAQPLSEALLDGAVIPTGLNVIYSGGARLTPSVARAIVDELESAIVVDGYGSTEAGGLGLALYIHGAPDPVGFRVGPDLALLDLESAAPTVLRPGTEGQIAYGGRLPTGYLGDPDATDARFLDRDGRRWFLTGDVGRIEPDGSLGVVGRVASSINTGGEKVYPEEVEAALLSHPTIVDAIVYPVADPRFGERVHAAVVLGRGVQLPADVDALLRSRLAGFKIPLDIHVVDTIPKTAVGKPDRVAALQQLSPT